MTTTVERFWSKVDKDGPTQPHMSTPCWVWTGAKLRGGYGSFGFNGKPRQTHRVSYELRYGVDPGSLCVCHRCDNPSCVNPEHLFLGTKEDNGRDMVRKGRQNFQKRPETLARGDAHWHRVHPERIVRGSAHKNSKLTDSDVIEIRKLLAEGVVQRKIAERFNVTQTVVSLVARRRTWSHVQ